VVLGFLVSPTASEACRWLEKCGITRILSIWIWGRLAENYFGLEDRPAGRQGTAVAVAATATTAATAAATAEREDPSTMGISKL